MLLTGFADRCSGMPILVAVIGGLLCTSRFVNPIPLPEEDCIKTVGYAKSIKCHIAPGLSSECVKNNVILIPEASVNFTSRPLLVNCTAPFPISGEVTVGGVKLEASFLSQSKFLFVRNAENVFNEATFVYSIGILGNWGGMRQVSIFRYPPGSDVGVKFWIFQPSKSTLEEERDESRKGVRIIEREPVGKATIVPCISPTYPKEPGIESSNTSEKFEYNPTTGYKLSSMDGDDDIKCYLHAKNKTLGEVLVLFKVVKRKEIVISPEFKHVVLFHDRPFVFSCRTRSDMTIEGEIGGKVLAGKTAIANSEYTSVLSITPEQLNPGDEGKVKCGDRTNTIHTWDVQVVNVHSNDITQIKKEQNSETVVECSTTKGGTPAFYAMFCQGEVNCAFAKTCFDHGGDPKYLCPQANLIQGDTSRCGQGKSCIKFQDKDPAFTQGLLHCRVGNHTYSSQYFKGFDGILYLDWKTAPVNALIEVSVPPSNITMYPHNSYPFGCRAAPFISSGKIQWVIRGKDGSEILLHKKRVEDIPSYYHLDANLYTVRESNIRLIYPNDYDVLCLVPLWNATGSLRFHKRINVAAPIVKSWTKEIVIIAVAIIIILIIPLVWLIWRLKKAKEALRNLTEQEVEQFMKGDPQILNSKNKDEHEKITATPWNQNLEIPRSKLIIDHENKLGEGAFGLVLKGRVENLAEDVAVKTVKPRCEVEQFKGFLSEIKIMAHIGRHPYVVALLGAHTTKIKEKIIYIVVEYCSNGSLDKLLETNRKTFVDQIVEGNQIDPNLRAPANVPLSYENQPEKDVNITNNSNYLNWSFTVNSMGGSGCGDDDFLLKTVDLLTWAYEIACGMDYLERKRVVHADLAARNVLIHANRSAKITDFGLSRQLMNYTQYVKKHQEPLPWRWMAEESLRNLTFSSQSDVWSYGVTLWEMFSLGDLPYPGLHWTVEFVDSLTNGLRMTKPSHATPFLYEMMLSCWENAPDKRPRFEKMTKDLEAILKSLNVQIKAELTAGDLQSNIELSIEDNLAYSAENRGQIRTSIAVPNVYENSAV